jgi:hypothetical protein
MVVTKADDWIGDSGTNVHVCQSRDLFVEFTPGSHLLKGVSSADAVYGSGTVELIACAGERKTPIWLLNVLYMPSSLHNLLSLVRLEEAGHQVMMSSGKLEVQAPAGHTFLTGARTTLRLYRMDVTEVPHVEAHSAEAKVCGCVPPARHGQRHGSH